MVDEPLRPLKHGRLRDWGWGKGRKKGGWRKPRCLRSLLLHLLHHLLMFSPYTSSPLLKVNQSASSFTTESSSPCHFTFVTFHFKKWVNGLPYFIELRQKRRSREENSFFGGTGIGGWWRDVLENVSRPLAERGVSLACCCRRTGHSMNMDESSEKGDAAGKTPPPFKPMQAWTMRAVFHWKH